MSDQTTRDCPVCDGTGRRDTYNSGTKPCHYCNATGRVPADKWKGEEPNKKDDK